MSTATITARAWTPEAVHGLGIIDQVRTFLADHGIETERCSEFEVLEDEQAPLRLRARVYRLNDQGAIYADLGQVASEVVEVPLQYEPPFTNVEWR